MQRCFITSLSLFTSQSKVEQQLGQSYQSSFNIVYIDNHRCRCIISIIWYVLLQHPRDTLVASKLS